MKLYWRKRRINFCFRYKKYINVFVNYTLYRVRLIDLLSIYVKLCKDQPTEVSMTYMFHTLRVQGTSSIKIWWNFIWFLKNGISPYRFVARVTKKIGLTYLVMNLKLRYCVQLSWPFKLSWTCFSRQLLVKFAIAQRRIWHSVQHLSWRVLRKKLTDFSQPNQEYVGEKAKERISNQVMQENKSRQVSQKNKHLLLPCVSRDKRCSFFEKFDVLCFLVSPALRFPGLLYYRQLDVLCSKYTTNYY